MGTDALIQFKDLGLAAALAFAAVGSALGTGIASMAAVGAWKKGFAQNKPAPFILTIFAGAPLTQTVYGMILMNIMTKAVSQGNYLWSVGILCGIAIGASALMQGKAGAVAADALGETGKGFGSYLAVIGIIETVALFVLAFAWLLLGRLVGA